MPFLSYMVLCQGNYKVCDRIWYGSAIEYGMLKDLPDQHQKHPQSLHAGRTFAERGKFTLVFVIC